MPNFEAKGVLIAKTETEQKSDKFKIRTFVIEVAGDKPEFSDFLQLQLSNNNCDKIDSANIGDEIEVKVNVRGRKYKNKEGVEMYFNSLDCWFVKVNAQATATTQPQYTAEGTDEKPDLPF